MAAPEFTGAPATVKPILADLYLVAETFDSREKRPGAITVRAKHYSQLMDAANKGKLDGIVDADKKFNENTGEFVVKGMSFHGYTLVSV